MKKRGATARTQRQKEIAALVDEAGRLQEEIAKAEDGQRTYRQAAMEAGRPDLAAKFISAPVLLHDLADFLWLGKALVFFSSNSEAKKIAVPPQPQDFPTRFELQRSAMRIDREAIAQRAPEIVRALNAKFQSDLRQRLQKSEEGISRAAVIREWAIQFSWLYPPEEWASIFPIAEMAGDFEFVQRINAAHQTKNWLSLDAENVAIVLAWHGFEVFGAAEKIPPLKHWSDKAACRAVEFISGEDLSLAAYQQRKSRLQFHFQKPMLVSSAKLKGDVLICQRD